jgi:hypothetical protein
MLLSIQKSGSVLNK